MRKDLNLIDFDEDYYAILGLTKDDIPEGKDPVSRKETIMILQTAYRTKIFEHHPDRPHGDEEKFKLVVKAHTILSDYSLRKSYNSGKNPLTNIIDGKNPGIDWENMGSYRKNSLADIVGQTISKKIVKESNIEGLSVKFVPEDESSHNYSWEFEIEGFKKELILSIIEDEEEVLRLTSDSKEISDNTLPFKIYIYFPTIKMILDRDFDEEHIDEDVGAVDVIKGKIRNIKYLDADILSTVNYQYAMDFVSDGSLKDAVKDCIDGNIQDYLNIPNGYLNVENADVLTTKDMNRIEQTRLKEMLGVSDGLMYGKKMVTNV